MRARRAVAATRATAETGARAPRSAPGACPFWRGALEALATIALFVAGGLGVAATLESGPSRPTAAPALYPPAVAPEKPAPRLILVDGYNVLNVGLLAGREREGWWRSHFRDELIGRIEAFEERDAEVWVVFDGAEPVGAGSPGRVRAVFAPSADEWLIERVGERGAAEVTIVTADRRLAARARRRGAEVVAPARFLARCPTRA